MKFNDLSLQWKAIEEAALPEILSVLNTGNFILGGPVSDFEKDFAKWNGNKHAIGVANGTDALKICVAALDLKGKSKFYVPANTYIATLLGVVFSLAKDYEYELVDCDDHYQIDCTLLEMSLERDKGKFNNSIVMPVHLYGHSCDMNRIMALKAKYGFKMIEDCSQAHGTRAECGRKVGSFGDISAFSLYPGKNLGAAGDAGIITTDDDALMDRCLYLRNLGSKIKYQHDVIGWNSRLDTLQAVILKHKLKMLDSWNVRRNEVAQAFDKGISNEHVVLPKTASYCTYNTYHIYPILTKHREEFMQYLNGKGIPTLIHYPIAIEKTGAFDSSSDSVVSKKNAVWWKPNTRTLEYADQLVSLPMHPFLTADEITTIVDAINLFKPIKG